MFISKKSMARRTFLRGAGAAIALPLLDAMLPAGTALANTVAKPQTRYAFLHLPHGAIMGQFTPKTVGKSFELSPILKPFRAVQELHDGDQQPRSPDGYLADSRGSRRLLRHRTALGFLERLAHKKDDGPGHLRRDHHRPAAPAQHMGQDTPLPSLELCIEDVGALGVCGAGYSCSYSNTISWSSPTSPLPMERNPQVIFERLFGTGSTQEERQRPAIAPPGEHPRLRRRGGFGAGARARCERSSAPRRLSCRYS